MSQENVLVVQAVFAAWNAGDMDAWADFLAPGVISRPPEGWPEPGPFVGREAVVRQFSQQRETFDLDAAKPISDFIEIADRVAVRLIWGGRGQGPEMKMEQTVVCTLRNGKILAFEWFWDHAEAIETLGLSEQDAHAGS
jgi:ketosteroid isomerase-like protein